ncbi:hypothetical protein TorRG33x02_302490 [Trema orientale]|uniref:Uncharacterized protein n=1 Tax=Trema orientale TaxID=63057 RepID=A0A2P5C0C7_TREOI|nr:hypothetical protein TorRG33x02_302490 [Trema orientale]
MVVISQYNRTFNLSRVCDSPLLASTQSFRFSHESLAPKASHLCGSPLLAGFESLRFSYKSLAPKASATRFSSRPGV